MFISLANEIVNDGLILYLDAGIKGSYSGSGSTWADLSKGNDGSLINSPTYINSNGGGFYFNGSNQYANISPAGDFIFVDQDVTFECWCSFVDNNSSLYRALLCSSSNTISLPILTLAKARGGVLNNGAVHFQLYTGTNSYEVIDTLTGDDYPTGGIYHFCGVLGLISGTYKLSLYRAGNLVATGDTGLTSFALSSSNAGFQVGAFPWSASNRMLGNIYLSRVYTRALSAAEINQNFQVERKRFGA